MTQNPTPSGTNTQILSGPASTAPSTPSLTNTDHGERYWLILQNNVEWLKFSETKASIILTSYGVLFTIFYTNAGDVFKSVSHPGAIRTLVIFFGIFSLVSIVAAFLAVRPRLRNKNPTSILYFRHIYKQYSTPADYKRAAHNILDDQDKYADHLTEQIHSISKVANNKYVYTGVAVWAFAASVIILVIAVVIYFNLNTQLPAK